MGEEARKSEKSCSVPRLVWGGGRGGMGVTARGPHTPWLKSHQYYGGGAPPTGPHPKVKQSPSRCLWGVGRGFLCPPPLGGGFIGDGSLHPTTPASPAPPRPGPKEKPPQNGGISRSKVQTRDRGGGTGYRGTPPPIKHPQARPILQQKTTKATREEIEDAAAFLPPAAKWEKRWWGGGNKPKIIQIIKESTTEPRVFRGLRFVQREIAEGGVGGKMMKGEKKPTKQPQNEPKMRISGRYLHL